jgi:hypothetical protein
MIGAYLHKLQSEDDRGVLHPVISAKMIGACIRPVKPISRIRANFNAPLFFNPYLPIENKNSSPDMIQLPYPSLKSLYAT